MCILIPLFHNQFRRGIYFADHVLFFHNPLYFHDVQIKLTNMHAVNVAFFFSLCNGIVKSFQWLAKQFKGSVSHNEICHFSPSSFNSIRNGELSFTIMFKSKVHQWAWERNKKNHNSSSFVHILKAFSMKL